MELSTQLKINDKKTCLEAVQSLKEQSKTNYINENIQRYIAFTTTQYFIQNFNDFTEQEAEVFLNNPSMTSTIGAKQIKPILENAVKNQTPLNVYRSKWFSSITKDNKNILEKYFHILVNASFNNEKYQEQVKDFCLNSPEIATEYYTTPQNARSEFLNDIMLSYYPNLISNHIITTHKAVSSQQLIKLYDSGAFQSVEAKTYLSSLPKEALEHISHDLANTYIKDRHDLSEAFNPHTEFATQEYSSRLRKKFIEDLEFFPLYFIQQLNELAPDLIKSIFSYSMDNFKVTRINPEEIYPQHNLNIVQHLINDRSSHSSYFEFTQYLYENFKELVEQPVMDNIGTYSKEVSYFEYAIRHKLHYVLQSFAPVFNQLNQEGQHILVSALFNMGIPMKQDDYDNYDSEISRWPKSLEYYPYDIVYEHSKKFGHLLSSDLNKELQTILLNKKLNVELDSGKSSTSRFKV